MYVDLFPWSAMHQVLPKLVAEYKPKTYLEIGVREGDSLRVVLSGGTVEHVVLSDTWGPHYGGSGRGNADHIKAILAEYPVTYEIISGDSKITIPLLRDCLFDMITVDGDHSAIGAKADLGNTWPLLANGGILVFDDITHPDHLELYDVALEFARRRRPHCVKIIEEKHGHGVMVFRKRIAHNLHI